MIGKLQRICIGIDRGQLLETLVLVVGRRLVAGGLAGGPLGRVAAAGESLLLVVLAPHLKQAQVCFSPCLPSCMTAVFVLCLRPHVPLQPRLPEVQTH